MYSYIFSDLQESVHVILLTGAAYKQNFPSQDVAGTVAARLLFGRFFASTPQRHFALGTTQAPLGVLFLVAQTDVS